MPAVPRSNVVPLPQQPQMPKVDPTYLAMAAAIMHEQGRLFEPEQPKVPNDRSE